MSGWTKRWRKRIRALVRKDAVERELDEELAFHLEMETQHNLRAGMSPDEARRRAALAFGGVEKAKEEVRDARMFGWVTGLSLDLRLGGRMLRKYPGLALVAGLALAVAIGGGAAYLEMVNDLFRPALPFPDGGRVVGITRRDAATGESDGRALYDVEVWRRELKSVEELGAYRPLERNLITGDGRAEPVEGVEISASAFRVTGARPLLGRPLVEDDERPGAPPVVVLGHALWRARFGGDPGVVGRTVRLGSAAHTVVGVMPEGFAFPVNHALWVPLQTDGAALSPGEGPEVRVFGRLAPGVSPGAAQSEITALGLRAAADHPETHRHLRPRVQPYVESLWSAQQDGVMQMRILYAVNLFFLGLLGVCGANVAALVFARTATREGEITVRTALGAGRARIVTQLFAEALVLASAAAAVGLAAAALAMRWIKGAVSSLGATPPFWWDAGLSPRTLLYAALLTLLAAAIVGVVPALKATGPRLQGRLKHAAMGGSSMELGRVWTGVVVAQVALTVLFLMIVVMVGWNVRTGRYGPPALAFPAQEYLSVRLEMDAETSLEGSDDEALAPRFGAAYRELERRLEAEPGVAAVTWASGLPGATYPGVDVEIDGAALPGPAGGERWVRSASVDTDFFSAFGAPVVAGRAFDARDLEPGRSVAVVDQTFVREVLGGRDPVGLRVRPARDADGRETAEPWYEIVGVVRDLTASPDKPANDAVLYRPGVPGDGGPLHVAVHIRGSPEALAPRLRAVASAVDPTLRLHDLVPLDQTGRGDRLAYGVFVRVLAVFGAIALLLSAAGVYSLLSFTVARRTREIGIRAALGAAPGRVVAAVFSRAFRQVGIGVLAGSVPGSLLVARGAPEVARGGGVLVGLAAFAAVAVFMLAVGVLASLVPARRALRIEPTEALRSAGDPDRPTNDA